MGGKARTRFILIALLLLAGSLPALAQAAYKFDMGPVSGLKAGYTPVDTATLYSAPQGYGWVVAPTSVKDSRGLYWMIFGRYITINDAMPRADDLTLDSAASPNDMTFRVDLPNGTYDVLAYLGDGATCLWYMDIVVNGVTVAEDIDALTPHTRTRFLPTGGPNDPYIGGIAKRRFTVNVTGGNVVFTFTGGPNRGPLSRYFPELGGSRDLRGAFQYNSVMGLEIHDHQEYPFARDGSGDLICNVPSPNPQAIAGMNLFNSGDIQGAWAAWEAIPENNLVNKLTKADALMWLVGHPEIEAEQSELGHNEMALTQASVLLLDDVVASDPELYSAWDLYDMALDADAAYYQWGVMRGYGYYGQGNYPYHRAYVIWEHLCQQILLDPTSVFDPAKLRETPYRYKGMIYCARIVCGYDPNRVTEAYQVGKEILRDKIEPLFPGNRYVNLYVYRTWNDEWYLYDYMSAVPPGAPDWAKYMWVVYNELIDLSEWWVVIRQHPISREFGGGFSDDVEIAPLFGFLPWVCKDSSRICDLGYKLFNDAIWDSDEIDRDKGFSAKYADAEHVCEPIGYSQPFMIPFAYGNPRYIERNLLTMKTVRDFLTGINSYGHRHFKANYFSATQISTNNNDKCDSPINVRGIVGGPWLLYYNDNPATEQLFQEYADAWLADSYRTEKSKPAGMLPANMGYPTDEMGGTNAPNWYQTNQGTLNKFPGYQHYEYKLQAMRYLRTKDAKYLDPFIAATNLALSWHYAGRPPSPTEGSSLWAGQQLAGGAAIIPVVADLTEAADLTTFDTFLNVFAADYAAFQKNTLNKTPLVNHMYDHHYNNILLRWPFMTTEAMMTDRIAYGGILGVTSYYLGADWANPVFGFPVFACTYENTTRDFAGLPVKVEPDDLRILCYLFRAEEREIRIRPWRLEVGGTYLLQAGPDADENHEIDTVEQSYSFTLAHRGDPMPVLLPPREVYLVKMTRTSPGVPVPPPAPDLGLSAEDDIVVTPANISVTVHNIGNAAASNIRVQAWDGYPGKGTLLGDSLIGALDAPNDLNARKTTVSFPWTPMPMTRAVFASIDPNDEIGEITEVNNVDLVWYPVGQTKPLAVALADRTTVAVTQPVAFSHLKSLTPLVDRELVLFEWDFDGDGTFDFSTTDPYRTPTCAYPSVGLYTAALRVTDNGDPAESDIDTVRIEVIAPPVGFVNDVESPQDDWTATGLWHVVDTSGIPANPYALAHSATKSWWYGRDASGDYNTGAANKGEIVSPLIRFPDDGRLLFWSYQQTENNLSYDTRKVYVSTNGGGTWTPVYVAPADPKLAWHQVIVDVSAYSGELGLVKFEFDTIDYYYNNYRGWYVDDIVLATAGAPALNDDMESGSDNWTASGLWHMVSTGDPYGMANSGTHSWWYGQNATGNYNTGATNKGDLTSIPFNLPGGYQLRFASWEEVEPFYYYEGGYDLRRIYLTTDGIGRNLVYTCTGATTGGWVTKIVDLSMYSGPFAQVSFDFDTVDAQFNNYRGWYVDDVRVGPVPSSNLDDDIESGPGGWLATNLWHIVNTDTSPYGLAHSGKQSWWYGRDSTGNYNTGATNSGTLDSTLIDLPTDKAVEFYSWEQVEPQAYLGYDLRQVLLTTNDGGNWSLVHTSDGAVQNAWHKVRVDLSAYSGYLSRVRFKFDTVDHIYNDYRGWYVDDVKLVDSTQVGLSDGFEGVNTWTSSGLWHIVDAQTDTYGVAHGGTKSWWYGQNSRGDYDTGARNFGALTSSGFELPPASTLSFWSWEDTEAGTDYDVRDVFLSTNGGSTWALIKSSPGTTSRAWYKLTVNLAQYTTSQARIRFYFDSVDELYNNYRGWYVDDVLVSQ